MVIDDLCEYAIGCRLNELLYTCNKPVKEDEPVCEHLFVSGENKICRQAIDIAKEYYKRKYLGGKDEKKK